MNINLNELTIENMGQWPKPVKIGLVVVISLFLIGLGYWLIVKANFDNYNVLKTQETALRTDFESKQYEASNLFEYRNQIALMQERFGNMLKQLPTENEMPGLLEDISKTGVASGLTFVLFAPTREIPHDFYVELPIEIAVVGNYHQFAMFLSHIAQMGRIVTLHNLAIETQEQKQTSQKQNSTPGEKLTMKLTAKIYRYRTK